MERLLVVTAMSEVDWGWVGGIRGDLGGVYCGGLSVVSGGGWICEDVKEGYRVLVACGGKRRSSMEFFI